MPTKEKSNDIDLKVPNTFFYGTGKRKSAIAKVWIFKGDIMEHDPSARDRRLSELKESPSRTQKSSNMSQERAS